MSVVSDLIDDCLAKDQQIEHMLDWIVDLEAGLCKAQESQQKAEQEAYELRAVINKMLECVPGGTYRI